MPYKTATTLEKPPSNLKEKCLGKMHRKTMEIIPALVPQSSGY